MKGCFWSSRNEALNQWALPAPLLPRKYWQTEGQVTSKDEAMVSALLPIDGKSQKVLFERLPFENSMLRALSPSTFCENITSNTQPVLLSLESWKKKDLKLSEELKRFVETLKLSLLFVMNAYTEPKFTRKLMVF